jgi:hypothetical protein
MFLFFGLRYDSDMPTLLYHVLSYGTDKDESAIAIEQTFGGKVA